MNLDKYMQLFNRSKFNDYYLIILIIITGIVFVIIPDCTFLHNIDTIINSRLPLYKDISLKVGTKLVWIIWCSGIILIFNGLCALIKSIINNKNYLFIIQIVGSFLIIILGYRILMGVGLGIYPLINPSGMVPSGIIYGHEDNLNYLSFASQARFGSNLFTDLGTIEPHRALYFNPFFIAIGKLSAWFYLPIVSVFFIVGIFISVPIVISAAYLCAKSIGIPEWGAKWTTIFAAFSSGLTVPLFCLGLFFNFSPPIGTDLGVMDSIISSTLLVYPLHSFALALLSIALFLMLNADNDYINLKLLITISAALLVTTLLLAFTHPYESLLFLFSYAIYCIYSTVAYSKKAWKRRGYILIIICAAVIPIIIYNIFVAQQPVWNHGLNSSISMANQRTRLAWIIGYGSILPLSLYGGYFAFKKSQYEKARWFAIWALLLISMLIVVNTEKIKICDGGHFPICILAGLGFYELVSYVSHIKSTLLRNAVKILTAIMCLSLFLTFPGNLIRLYVHSYDIELNYAADKIRSLSKNDKPKVLCDIETGHLLPVLGGVQVYAGHWGLTPDVAKKSKELIEAGIDVPSYNNKRQYLVIMGNFNNIIRYNHFDYLLIRKDRPIYTFIDGIKNIDKIECYYRWCLYRINNG